MSSSVTNLPLSSLRDFIVSEAKDSKKGTVALLTGHFAIFSAGGMPEDHLLSADVPEVARPMVSFTKTTWEASMAALAKVPECDVSVALLADDVAFVRPNLADRSQSERLAAALSEHYLGKLGSIPEYHAKVLAEYGVSTGVLLGPSIGRYVFSERELKRELVQLSKSETVRSQPAVRVGDQGSSVSVQMSDHEYTLVYAGNTNCVGAYLGLHRRIIGLGIRKMILLVPNRCFGQMCTGSVVAPLIGLSGCEIVTVMIPEPDTGDIMSVSRGGK